jgi:ABC-type nitrate/sulfonate/bicarbonate transport system substrate-binding protein
MCRRSTVLLGMLLAALLSACNSPPAASTQPAPASAPAGSAAASAPVPAGAATPGSPAQPAASAASAPASPATVRVGSQQLTGNAGIYIAQDKGYFTEQGLDVQYVDVGLTTQMIPPLAAGQVDAVAVGLLSGTFNAIARGIGIRVVADSGMVSPDPTNGFSAAFAFTTSKEMIDSGRIRDFADLKDKVCGTTAGGGGSTPDIVLDKALSNVGLTLDDIDRRGMTFADLPQAVANKSVDFALGVEPFIALGEAQNIWVRWKSPTEIYPGAQIAALLYGPTMSEAGKDVGNRFMVAYTRGLRDYYEAFGPARKGRPEIVSILVNNTAVKQPALYDQMAWNYLNPNCSVNLKTLPADLEWYVAKGLTPPLDVNQVVDNSYCEYAVQQLGAYPQ